MNQTINNMGKTKTIFKGVINGVEFDNVAEYNKRLTELLAADENVNASTSTSTVDTCECCEKPLVNMLPGFDSEKAIENYIDKFVTDNDEFDKSNMDSYKEYLNENLTGINKAIRNMDAASLDNYRNDLNEVCDIIDEDLQDTLEAIHRKEMELKTLNKAKSVLHMWNEFYNYLRDLTKKTLNDRFPGYDKPISSECKYSGEEEPAPGRIATEEECVKVASEARAKEIENTLLSAVNSLLEAFGVKK